MGGGVSDLDEHVSGDADEDFGCVDWLTDDDEPPLQLSPLDPDESADGEDPAPEEDDPVEDEDEPPSAPSAAAASLPPTAPCDVVVGPGDCLLSLARRYETSVEIIWSAPENAALRARRARPNQLLPGDVVHVPEKVERSLRVASDRRHRFRLSEPEDCEVCIRLRRAGEDRAGVPFTMVLHGSHFQGVTDGSGRVRVRVPRSARGGFLVVHDPAGEERYPVRLGHLDPLDDDAPATGAQARLNHLGFLCGAVDGVIGPRTRRALRLFQRSRELPITGELDAPTREALRSEHGS